VALPVPKPSSHAEQKTLQCCPPSDAVPNATPGLDLDLDQDDADAEQDRRVKQADVIDE
jgi:hypothetical protein